jgi:hypothetical protein
MSRNAVALVVGLAFSVTALGGWSAGAVNASPAVPKQLVGTWAKTISARTWLKEKVFGEPAGRWAIKVGPSGVTSLYVRSDGTTTNLLTTMRTSVSGGTVTFGPTADGYCPGRATYRWITSGSSLDFTLVKDDCSARTVLLTTGTFARQS